MQKTERLQEMKIGSCELTQNGKKYNILAVIIDHNGISRKSDFIFAGRVIRILHQNYEEIVLLSNEKHILIECKKLNTNPIFSVRINHEIIKEEQKISTFLDVTYIVNSFITIAEFKELEGLGGKTSRWGIKFPSNITLLESNLATLKKLGMWWDSIRKMWYFKRYGEIETPAFLYNKEKEWGTEIVKYLINKFNNPEKDKQEIMERWNK